MDIEQMENEIVSINKSIKDIKETLEEMVETMDEIRCPPDPPAPPYRSVE